MPDSPIPAAISPRRHGPADIPAWFEQLMNAHRPDIVRSCPDFNSLGAKDREEVKTERLKEWQRQRGATWKALAVTKLRESQTRELMGHCWDYGAAKLYDAWNGEKKMSRIEKEQRRLVGGLVCQLRDVANQLSVITACNSDGITPRNNWLARKPVARKKNGQAADGDMPSKHLFKEAVDRGLAAMLWPALYGTRYHFREECGDEEHEVFERFPLLRDELTGLADAVELCLNSRTEPSKKRETQAFLWGRMRENALLGSSLYAGEAWPLPRDRASEEPHGMVDLVIFRGGSYETLAQLARTIHPELEGLTGNDVRREVKSLMSGNSNSGK